MSGPDLLQRTVVVVTSKRCIASWSQFATLFDATIAFSATISKQLLLDLQRNRWINRGTRAVFIDVLVFNANVNLFANVR
jgi:hypothetical protein